MHRQGPTSVQVLKIKKIHVTTELSGYLLVRGLKLSWFRSISYTKGKILNAPIEAVRPFWIYIHMAGTGTTCWLHLTGHISELRTDRSSHSVVQLQPSGSPLLFFRGDGELCGWWWQSCPNSQAPLPSSPHRLPQGAGLLRLGLTQLWLPPPSPSSLHSPSSPPPPPLPLLHYQHWKWVFKPDSNNPQPTPSSPTNFSVAALVAESGQRACQALLPGGRVKRACQVRQRWSCASQARRWSCWVLGYQNLGADLKAADVGPSWLKRSAKINI